MAYSEDGRRAQTADLAHLHQGLGHPEAGLVVARREDHVQGRRGAFYISAARRARLDRARVRRRRRVRLDLDEAPRRPLLLDRGELVVYLRRDAE